MRALMRSDTGASLLSRVSGGRVRRGQPLLVPGFRKIGEPGSANPRPLFRTGVYNPFRVLGTGYPCGSAGTRNPWNSVLQSTEREAASPPPDPVQSAKVPGFGNPKALWMFRGQPGGCTGVDNPLHVLGTRYPRGSAGTRNRCSRVLQTSEREGAAPHRTGFCPAKVPGLANSEISRTFQGQPGVCDG